jgi:hypothetical protein
MTDLNSHSPTADQKVSGSNPLGRASLRDSIARMLPLKRRLSHNEQDGIEIER